MPDLRNMNCEKAIGLKSENGVYPQPCGGELECLLKEVLSISQDGLPAVEKKDLMKCKSCGDITVR